MEEQAIYIESPVAETKESNFEKIWKDIDASFLPKKLEGTNFEIPYKPLPARQLVTRAEFARETGFEKDPHSHVGRKINRKSFRHPLSQKEYLVIKGNRGNTPQLFFSYDGEKKQDGPGFEDLGALEDFAPEQVSRFAELIRDERAVRLSRLVEGSNRKGYEHTTASYIEYGPSGPQVRLLYREDEYQGGGVKNRDYITSGSLVRREHDTARVIVFFKVQSRDWGGDALFIAREVGKEGKNIFVKRISLKELPFFEEIVRENPDSIFDAVDDRRFSGVSVECVAKEKNLEYLIRLLQNKEEKAILEVPKDLDASQFLTGLGKDDAPLFPVSLRIEKEDSLQKSEGVSVDPEVDPDLDFIVERLKEAFGDALLSVYFYGSIPRGYKHLQSDIDILAVIKDKAEVTRQIPGFDMDEEFKSGKLLHDALGSWSGLSRVFPFRGIEIHTISERKFEKTDNLMLGEFLRNIREDAVEIFRKEI